ncbi:MAG: RsmB/NOP family class I SAM-dependent RNA methyltransferase [Desulfurococcaceae archaeon]
MVIHLSARDIEALVKAVKFGEEIKPSQQAKREVFREYKILGTEKDQALTGIFYDLWKRMGIIDRIICEVTGINNVAILDPWLRAALRVAIKILVFQRHLNEPRNRDLRDMYINYFKTRIAKFLSDTTHPYVGVYFWDVVDKIANYKWRPRDMYEIWEYKYMVSSFIVKKMIELVGKKDAKLIFRKFNEPYPINIRVNVLKASVEEVLEELRKEGYRPERGRFVPTVIKFHGPYNFEKSRLFNEGKIIIQDEAAAMASMILDPKPGEVIVDMCAAPGGKTEHMGELMRNDGLIHAFDINEDRINRMKELLSRAGINIVKIYKEDARRACDILGEGIADRVLLDAPCTSSGTLMKNQELRWRITREGVEKACKLQYELLETAIRLTKKGGKILYTTCSLFKEENEDIVEKILNKYRDRIRLITLNGPFSQGFIPGTMRAWPHIHGTIGFFYALFERIG